MNPSLECELARVQMKRYLGGEELPPRLMEELEQHVHACASCSHYLDSQKLQLAAKLAGSKQQKVKEAPAPQGPKDSDVFTKPRQAWLTPKTLGLAAALALVLFAMSAVAKDPTLLFGPKAIQGKALPAPTNPSTEEEGEGSTHDSGDEHSSAKSEEDAKIGEIMTGETIQKEIEDSLKEQEKKPHAGGSDHEPQAEKEPVNDHPEPAPESHEVKAPVETKKEPELDLVVAEEGRPAKKKSPAPHPRAVPARPATRTRSASRPIKRATAASRPAVQATSSGSIRIYDASGAPINP